MVFTRRPRSGWIDEGLRTLAAGGPDAVRIESLARALGVSKGGFYWHFGDRQALLEELLDTWERVSIDEVIEIPPRTLVKPHNHTREDEFTHVLAGTVGVRTGDQVVEAPTGASLVKPRGIPHAMWNADAEPARVLEILSPGGLEDYFEELAPALREHAPPPEYYALAERYGLTIVDDWIEELERTYGVKL